MYLKLLLFVVFSFAVSCEPQSNLNEEDDGKSSLVFVFDTTGSMYNDLRQLREGAEMILDTALEENGVIADFVFVPFHDPKVGPATVTTDKEVFKAALSVVQVRGGGDCPEKSLGGIQLALSVSRPRSFVYVFTDATASDHKLVGNVLDAVQRKQSQVVFVLTGHCNDLHRPHYKVYGQIAAASSGQVFNLNKTNVHKVLEFVRSSIRGRTVNLGSAVNPPGYDYTQGIPIDSNLKEVTVSVSGVKPSIRVVNPSGQELTGPPQLVTTLDLAEIMVVKVLQPEPGNWTIVTGSEEHHSVKVVGVSNVTFTHGFSVERPATIAETSYRPLQGAYNHMMIRLSQADGPVRVSYAEILGLDGKMLFELPLREIDSQRNVYIADPFVPPDDFFYIAIDGRDEYNQELRRVGATAVQAKPPSVPYLTVTKYVEARAHDSVTLMCNVESLVPVTAVWTKDNARIQTETSSLQSTSIQYVITDMSEGYAGSYRCIARNVAGSSSDTTEVSLLVDPPQVTIAPESLTAELGDDITVRCTVVSDALLLKYQLVFNGSINQYVTDINMEPNIEGLYVFTKTIYNASERDSGIYSCVAANRGGEISQSAYISVESQPSAQILGPHALTRLQHSDVQLACRVERAKRVVWLDPNGGVARDIPVEGSYNDLLDVRDVSADGVWSCVAVRGSRNATDSVEITILIKPEVSIEGSKNISVINGTKIEVVCNIVAKPAPRIIWHRETEDFLNNTITAIEPNKYRSVLTLNSSIENVEGTYFCFGENSEGIHQDRIDITVTRKMTLEEGFIDMNVQLYSQITLPCHIDSYPPPTITWYHNDTDLKIDDNLYMSENNNMLYILKVDFDNLGSYKCEADNGLEKMEVAGRLNVVGLEAPILVKDPVQKTALRGKSTILTCRLTKGNPLPSVSWQYRHGIADMFATLPDGVIANVDSTELIIANVTAQHSGLYRCVAENVIGKDLYDVQLVVQFPPEIIKDSSIEDQPLLMEAGRKVTMSCKAAGVPPPIVVWSKDHQPVRYSKNVYLTDTSDLVIEQATEYDSGLFTCNVTSALGSSLRNFTLVVYVPPIISPPESSSEVVVLEGDLVSLPCVSWGAPAPSVSWLHNGDTVQGDRKYIDAFGLRFVANLTDFGEYTCIAKNLYGNASFSYFVYIWVAPYIEPLDSSKDVLLGADVSLECNVVGFPVPSVLWEFRDQLLQENTTDLSFNELGNLYVRNATAKHEGVYSCVAENIAGVAKKNIYLHVNEPPTILADNFTGPYIATSQDTQIVISCRPEGKPRPFIAWAKDDSYIDKDARYSVDSDGSLTIKDLSEELSGQYVCVAKNAVGTANKTVSVEIYPSPTRMQADESQATVTTLEGTNATIDCPIRASDKDIVKWYKDAKLISTNLLNIPNITRHNTSTYACVVTNAIGSAYSNVRVNVEWPPMFVTNATDVEVIRGDDWYFDCRVDVKPAAKTKWLFNSKFLLGEDKERLKLINIQLWHTGTYKCIVSNPHGTITRQFTLDVLEPPFISEFDLLDVQLKEGVNVTLDCEARGSPDPNVTWSFNNTNWLVQNTSLTTYNIGRQSEGLYRCDATNEAGTTHIVYRVGVTSPAKVEEIVLYTQGQEGGLTVVDDVEVVLNSHIRLSCKASGYPSAAVQWVYNGNIVSRNSEGMDYADLVMDATRGGQYTCMADNKGGGERRRVNLNVLEPPKIFQDIFGGGNSSETVTKLEVILGQSFYLHCHPYGNPAPAVYWFKDDLPLRFFDDTMVSTDYGEVIVSNGARIEQSGNYTCVVRNKVGNASVVYLVDVLVPPPTPKENFKTINTKVGNQLSLTCPVVGTPAPVVLWVKHPYTEIGSDDPRVTLVDDSSILIINETEMSDSGRYSCIMTNKVGTTEVTFAVTIEKPPSIAGNVGDDISESLVVPLHRSVVLKCQADGNPPPSISWLKDTQQLGSRLSNVHRVLGNSLLAVWDARARDAGQYICVAENSGGTAHRRYNLLIQVPGKWTSWSEWSLCNVTCGLGFQRRRRYCHYTDDHNATYDKSTNPDKIVLDESSCKGFAADKRRCHMPACEASARWGTWSAWAACSATCGPATQARTRRCKKDKCVGDNVQIRKCPDLPRCGDYSEQNPSSVNEVFNSKENDPETSAYIPEATFETSPGVVAQPTEVEEFYIPPEQKYPTVFYDVKVTDTDNLDSSSRGSCDPGYRADSHTGACEDTDECLIDNNKCHSTQVCVNTPGAYRCTCTKGFFSLGVGQRCLDINECSQDTSGCEFACVNTAGGYVCACPRGSRLRTDRHTCDGPPPRHATSLYSKPLSHDELYSGEYLSANVDFPTRYLKNKN